MNMADFITFVIILALMLFLFVKRLYEDKYQREHPKEFAKQREEREKALRQFLRSLELEGEATKPAREPEPEPPAPPPTQKTQPKRPPVAHIAKDPFARTEKLQRMPYHAPFGMRSANIALGRQFGKEYEVVVREQESRARDLIVGQKTLKNAILLGEIIGAPGGKQAR